MGYNQLPVNWVKKRNPLIVLLFNNRNKDQSLQQLSVRQIDQHSADLCEISSAHVYCCSNIYTVKSLSLTHRHLIHYREYPPLLLSYSCSLCHSIYTEGCKANHFCSNCIGPCNLHITVRCLALPACGAGRARHLTVMCNPFSAIHPFASIGGRLGQLIWYNLSCVMM